MCLDQQKPKRTLKPATTSGQSKVTSFRVIKLNLEFISTCEESFPIPLKYIDVTRTTHKSLDVVQEKSINDYWNVDMDQILSDLCTGFTKFTLLNEKPPTG